jgi:hypothetical protein
MLWISQKKNFICYSLFLQVIIKYSFLECNNCLATMLFTSYFLYKMVVVFSSIISWPLSHHSWILQALGIVSIQCNRQKTSSKHSFQFTSIRDTGSSMRYVTLKEFDEISQNFSFNVFKIWWNKSNHVVRLF